MEEARRLGLSFPEGQPGTEHAYWRKDASFQVERIPPEYRLTIYERVQQWEKRLAAIRGACVACVFPDGYEGANKIGSGQVPIGDVLEALVGHDGNDTQKTYQDFIEVVKDIPAALFGSVECPPEGEADLIIVGDSSFALVANHDNPTTCSRLAFGELLQAKEYALTQIRTLYPGLKWGKALSVINHQVWELIEKIERENRLQSRPSLPILVVDGPVTTFMEISGIRDVPGSIPQTSQNQKLTGRLQPTMPRSNTRKSSVLWRVWWKFTMTQGCSLRKLSGTVTILATPCPLRTTGKWGNT